MGVACGAFISSTQSLTVSCQWHDCSLQPHPQNVVVMLRRDTKITLACWLLQHPPLSTSQLEAHQYCLQAHSKNPTCTSLH
jgi:hypothetical protein